MFVGYEPTSVLKFVAMDLYYSLTFDNLFFGYQSVDLLIPGLFLSAAGDIIKYHSVPSKVVLQ
jgi:hypothetical protein